MPLKWTSPDGVQVVKTLIFQRSAYRIDVKYEVVNNSAAPWSAAPYAQMLHDMPPVKRSYFDVDSYSFTGPAYWDGTKYEKLKITSKEDASLNARSHRRLDRFAPAPLRRGHRRRRSTETASLHAARARQ